MEYIINHNETREWNGITLYRLMGEDGSKGGWVEKAENLDPDFDGFIGKEAIIYGDAKVHGGDIYGGEIRGGEIFGGEIYHGIIYGGEIRGGIILGGTIRGGKILGGEILDGEFSGATIHDGRFWGGIILGGIFFGGEILGGQIWSGVYKETPPIIIGKGATCTLDSEGYICIACERHRPDYWLANYLKIGTAHGYSDAEIVEYKVYIDALVTIAKGRS